MTLNLTLDCAIKNCLLEKTALDSSLCGLSAPCKKLPVYSYLPALLKDTTAFYSCVFIIIITPVIFRAEPRITGGTTPRRTTEGAGRTAAHIATIVANCATDAVIAVEGKVWVIAYPFLRPGISYTAKVTQFFHKAPIDASEFIGLQCL